MIILLLRIVMVLFVIWLFAALIASVTGILGVLAAYYIVKSMPVNILTYIVAVVLIYMAVSFMISNKKIKQIMHNDDIIKAT